MGQFKLATSAQFRVAGDTSVCSPTRYGLLTGRYPWRSWLKRGNLSAHDRPLIGPDRPTLGTLLQGHGYRTAAVGKWHLGMDFTRLTDIKEVNSINRGIDFDAEIPDSPIDHGFHEFFGTTSNLRRDPYVYIRNNRFAANPETAQASHPGFYQFGEVLDRLTREAVSFIEREGQTEAPFFLYLPLHTPHVPLVPNSHFDDLTGLGAYADVVTQMDWTVGQVLDALDRVGVRDNTLVILKSDNGSYMDGMPVPNHADHQSNGMWRGGKKLIYEGGHRIPLFMQWPRGIEAGTAVDATVSLTDLYATLAEIVGEEPEHGVATDSVSLLPLLRGEAGTRGTPVVHHSNGGMFAIRDGRWKLVFGEGGGRGDSSAYLPPLVSRINFSRPWQLYDLEEDTGERNNLAATHPEEVARLEAALERIHSAEGGTLSGDATLSSLRIAGIDIGPFDSDMRTYAANMNPRIETVRVTAHPTDTDARVDITTPDGRRLYSKYSFGRYPHGQAHIELSGSNTTITVNVTASDKSTNTIYTVTLRQSVPVITGTAQVGETLTVDTSRITDRDGLANAVFSYQWLADGTEIAGATGSTYTPTTEDEGKAILVRVSFTDDRGNAETRTSPATAPVAPPDNPAAGAPAITGTVRVGETLTADASTITDADGLANATLAHQWLADGTDIPGATGVTYTLAPSGEGKTIRVRVSFTDDAGNSETRTSPATAPVAPPPNIPATGLPTITGMARVAETLTADTSGISDADGLANAAFTYQWLAGWRCRHRGGN